MAAAEAQVLKLMQRDNKPFGLQSLVDLLAHQGIKKAAISKALDSLVEGGKVIAKEFGKTKIFIPAQSDLAVLSKEELDAKQASIRDLGTELQQEKSALKELEQELQSWRSSLTDAELLVAIQQATEQLAAKQARLSKLQSGAVLVSAEERTAAVKGLTQAVDGWKKRKAIFRNIWGTISDGLEGKQEDLFEEMGIETDEAVGVSLKDMELLLPATGANKRPRTALGGVN